MARNNRFDLVIIGGGAAAFSAALKAETFNIKTAVVERGVVGGTCVNVGCVPSKNLLGAGEVLYHISNPSYSSISPCHEYDFDFLKTIRQKDNLVRYLRKQKYYDVLSSLENVKSIEGEASFLTVNTIKIRNDNNNPRVVEAKKFIVATGSSIYILPISGIENIDYLTNNEALSLDKKPSSMIIIGGRALGLEFARCIQGLELRSLFYREVIESFQNMSLKFHLPLLNIFLKKESISSLM
jgi:mercuric reductase